MVAFKDLHEHTFESTPLSPNGSFMGQNNIVVKRTKYQEANFQILLLSIFRISCFYMFPH